MSIFVYLIFLSFNEFVNVEKHARSRVVFFHIFLQGRRSCQWDAIRRQEKKIVHAKARPSHLPSIRHWNIHTHVLSFAGNQLVVDNRLHIFTFDVVFLVVDLLRLVSLMNILDIISDAFFNKNNNNKHHNGNQYLTKKSTRTTWKKNRTPISFQLLSPSFLRHHRLRFRKSRWVIHQHLRIMNTNPNDVPVSFDSAIVVDKCSFPINQIIF